MNHNEAKNVVKHFEIIKALAEGKKIEFKDSFGNWIETDDPMFSFNTEYRVKPEPRRFWRIEFDNGNVWSQHSLEEAAKTNLNSLIGRKYIGADKLRIVEYVEVMK